MAMTIMVGAPIMMVGGVVMALHEDVTLSLLLVVAVPVMAALVLTMLVYGVPPQYDPDSRKAMQEEFEQKWCKPLEAAGVKYRTVMEDGRPASVIADTAEQSGADLIVVGRRGRGGVAELVLGSVSHELVQHSKVPVLLIPCPPALSANGLILRVARITADA